MKILIKSCKILDTNNVDLNDSIKDILIEDSFISKIDDHIETNADHVISSENLHCSIGWIDGRANFCDPGFEYKEDLNSGIETAEKGGFTGVFITPNTQPRINGKSQLEYLSKKSTYSPVSLFPFGTVTENMEGKNLAELYDLQENGAIGYSDYNHLLNTGILYRALLYTKQFVSKVISFPMDFDLIHGGMVNEGEASVRTGLKSIPNLAEYIIIKRDLDLLKYTESQLHFTGISCAESVALIREAKKEGLSITCDVYLANLVYTENDVLGFDSNFKLMPPLRTETDRLALIAGLKDGTIDFICSNHTPEDKENKDLEFDLAEFGTIGIQTMFSQLIGQTELTLTEIITLLTHGPRKAFNLREGSVKEGEFANISLFNPDAEWVYSIENNSSKSKNSPLLGQTLKGKVIGIINNGYISLID